VVSQSFYGPRRAPVACHKIAFVTDRKRREARGTGLEASDTEQRETRKAKGNLW
jgi:hypothetical protein